ncbi:MAG: thioredoxin domain-containing protein [Chloroflexi bacterium]|nr:thioredoxin domain-containing protein [Chloroflexota bacterium]
MADIHDQLQGAGKPVSLREEIPAEPSVMTPPNNSSSTLTLVMTAAIFLLAGLLIATLVSGSGDGVDQDELRAVVNEAVGTQVAGIQPIAAGDGAGGPSQADLQVMVDQAVSTQVAALIPTNTPIPPTPTRIPAGVADDDDAFLGPADAPVVIVEFSDFQCSFCGRFYEETLPQIREKYPDQVKFVYRDFPIFGDASAMAAMAAECAQDQDMFWEMHNRLFDTHGATEPVTLDQETLVGFAGELGLDTGEFEQCLSSERYLDEVLIDFQAAREYGFQGTPGFVINGVVYTMGAQPFAVFDGIIQGELAMQQSGG